MSSYRNYKLIRFASYLSIFINLLIILIKSYGWLSTSSQSIFASLVDSLLDITSALINFVAIRLAMRPPDHKHRFGHEKFEDLAVFSQSIFFFFSSIIVIASCIKSLYFGSEITNDIQGINTMVICLILISILCIFQNYVVSKTSSSIIAIDRLHYFSDAISNIVIIASIFLTKKFWYFDALMGILVSLYIIYSSYELFTRAIKNLVDEEFAEEDKQKIINIVSKYQEVKGIHDIKTRYAAKKPFIQFHIEMDCNMLILKSHDITTNITKDIQDTFPNAEIIIYTDPHGINEHIIEYPEEGFRE